MSSKTPGRSILRASALMASGTMVSRILGFIRNAMLIAAVGATAGGVGAAFQTANTLPNTVFNLLASGIFDAVLVPQIVGAIKRRNDGDTYVNRLLTLAGTVLFRRHLHHDGARAPARHHHGRGLHGEHPQPGDPLRAPVPAPALLLRPV